MGQVHPDTDVRDAGTAAEERINKWRVALVFRDDLYRAVRAFAETGEATGLSGERKRLLDHWLRDFRRAGHELEPDARAELERLRTRLVELEVSFQRNINEYRDGIEVTREQLDGLPDSYIERLSPGEKPGTYRVSLDYPELYPFLEQARDRGLREELFHKHWNRAVDANRPAGRRRTRRSAHRVGPALLRRAAAPDRLRGRPGGGQRVPATRLGHGGHVRDHQRGLWARVSGGGRATRLARSGPPLRGARPLNRRV